MARRKTKAHPVNEDPVRGARKGASASGSDKAETLLGASCQLVWAEVSRVPACCRWIWNVLSVCIVNSNRV